MAWVRGIILLFLLAGIAWLVQREQAEGRLRQVDEAFLDFLVANSRDRFEQLPEEVATPPHPVVKVVLKRSEAAEYSDWPPQPLDWQMLLKGLQPFEPSVLVITTPLSWGHPPPDFVPAVAEALLPFPSVVLAAEAMATESASPDGGTPSTAFLGDLEGTLPRFERTSGAKDAATRLASIITPPSDGLRRSGEVGLIIPEEEGSALAVVGSGGVWLPTLPVQALARHSKTPYVSSRIRLGPGAGLYFSQGLYVPLTHEGRMLTPKVIEIPEVNALNLITDGFAQILSEEEKEILGKGKVIFVGLKDDLAQTLGELDRQALAVASALSNPRIHEVSPLGQRVIWGIAGLLALGLGAMGRRAKALRWGLITAFLAFAIGFVAFQSSLWWFPPSVPLAILLTGTVFGMLFGRRPAEPATHSPAPTTEESHST